MKGFIRKSVLSIVVLMMAFTTMSAQDSLDVSLGADLVSRYVWRGMDQGTGASLQPSLGLSIKGFSLSAWGSSSLVDKDVDEFDITLAYAGDHLSVGLTDYFWQGVNADYSKYADDHFFELNVAYTVSEKVPLTIGWNTMLFGGKSGELDEDGDRMYSSYFSLGYSWNVSGISLEPAIGITPWKSQYYKEAAVMDITLKASKEIRVTDSFSLPIFSQVVWSPAMDKAHIVFGLTF